MTKKPSGHSLRSFHKGWEGENLAHYLLSKFSFIAKPFRAEDDKGSDFYCTLFVSERIENRDYLAPRNFFAIQIKSRKSKDKKISKDDLEITKKLGHISRFPFFWGVLTQETASLEIYSGEVLPLFLAQKSDGNSITGLIGDNKAYVKLVDKVENFFPDENGDFFLEFPKVAEINFSFNPMKEECRIKVEEMSKRCALMERNISSKNNKLNIFHFFNDPTIYFGPTNSKYIGRVRSKLLDMLAIVFINYKNLPELEIYKKFYEEIRQEDDFSDLIKRHPVERCFQNTNMQK